MSRYPALLHTGDLHVTKGPRFADTVQVLRAIIDIGRAANVGLWIVPGDLTGHEAPHVAEPEERNAVAEFFCEAAETGRVVVVRGNHDARYDLDIYARLRAPNPIHVVTRPTRIALGPLVVYGLPYPSKDWFMAGAEAGQAIEAQKAQIEDVLRQLLVAWRVQGAEDRSEGRVPVGAVHVHIGGSIVGGGEVLIGREIELAPHDLDELGFSYIALSHIHRRQQMAATAWYAGSPSAQNHGEAGDVKSVNVVRFDDAGVAQVEHVPTPARRLVTVDMVWQDGDWEFAGAPPERADLANAEVRVRANVPEEALALADQAVIERVLANVYGAHRVQVERVPIPHVRQRLAAVTLHGGERAADAYQRATTVAEKLELLWSTRDDAPPPEQRARILARLATMEGG